MRPPRRRRRPLAAQLRPDVVVPAPDVAERAAGAAAVDDEAAVDRCGAVGAARLRVAGVDDAVGATVPSLLTMTTSSRRRSFLPSRP